MSRDNWYRNEVWSPEVEKAFLTKLAKARSQRDQYLKVQISYLSKSYPKDALRLCELYHTTRRDKSWDLQVIDAAAKAHENLGNISEALACYREIVQCSDESSFYPDNVLFDMPFLIARKGPTTEFSFALQLLTRAQLHLGNQDISFAKQHFLFHATHALIRNRSGQKQEAIEHAVTALKVAGVKNSGLRYHRTIGLVGPEYRSTILALKSITTGYPTWVLGLLSKFT